MKQYINDKYLTDDNLDNFYYEQVNNFYEIIKPFINKDIMIHCYKFLNDKNKARKKNDRMGKSSQETI